MKVVTNLMHKAANCNRFTPSWEYSRSSNVLWVNAISNEVCQEALWCMQVIEKALKKLKLDAMIIQQGRLSDNKASVNKDDLLSMVRYGAEMVFSGGGGTITDEDIDAIIAKVTLPNVNSHKNVTHYVTQNGGVNNPS